MWWLILVGIMAISIDLAHYKLTPKGAQIRDFGRELLLRCRIPRIAILDHGLVSDLLLVVIGFLTIFGRPHALYTFCLSRIIRVGAIYLVRFPNPHPKCDQIRQRCHDLIISGHTLALMTVFLCNDYKLITGPLMLYSLYNIIIEFHHYSVDVYLAIIIALLCYSTSTQSYIPFEIMVKQFGTISDHQISLNQL